MSTPAKQSALDILARGLPCRTCRCQHFHVLYTRRAPGGRVLRCRVCRHCGRRMTTYEQSAANT